MTGAFFESLVVAEGYKGIGSSICAAEKFGVLDSGMFVIPAELLQVVNDRDSSERVSGRLIPFLFMIH